MGNTVLPDDVVYGRTALRQHLPWIVPESLTELEKHIRRDWEVWEWGAGGSTLYFAKRCAHVTSIEQNHDWVDRVNMMIASVGSPLPVDLRYVPQDHMVGYDKYADAILFFKDESFDLVYVDGEASCRDRCIGNAKPKVKPGAILLLDNSNWNWKSVFPVEEWENKVFSVSGLTWVGQPGTFTWETTLFIKRAK